ncbi:phosphonoacetate hydrolase [Frankia sp. CcI49]|nr:phosphonoacetate hydrolase [Frankia sp. CcI49]
MTRVEVNGREYLFGADPVVVICVDGSAPAYHERAVEAGRMPWLAGLLASTGAGAGAGTGTSWPAHGAMPALTNPNNLSIATGRPPAVHGISGNTYWDDASGTELPMTSPDLLRAPTLFAAAHAGGLGVAVVTAKDKLRRLLGTGLDAPGPARTGAPRPGAVCFSAEQAGAARIETNGIADVPGLIGRAVPEVYSAELSEFVLAAGVALLRDRRPDLTYLSLSDYVQHKHAPGTAAANDFYAMIDRYARALDELGATIVLTADHGMSAKSDAHGRPRVVHLCDEIARLLDGRADLRVVLPITDPYVAHHGALGSLANVHVVGGVESAASAGTAAAVAEALATLDGVQATYLRADAAREFAMPADRLGDVVVLADAATVLGKRAAAHDLSGLDVPLRSHGGLGELAVPFIVNRKLIRPPAALGLGAPARHGNPAAVVHNYDAFYAATTLAWLSRTAAEAAPRPRPAP